MNDRGAASFDCFQLVVNLALNAKTSSLKEGY